MRKKPTCCHPGRAKARPPHPCVPSRRLRHTPGNQGKRGSLHLPSAFAGRGTKIFFAGSERFHGCRASIGVKAVCGHGVRPTGIPKGKTARKR